MKLPGSPSTTLTEERPGGGRGLRAAAVAVLAVVALGLVSAARMLAFYPRVAPLDALLSGLLDWSCWLPFVPVVFALRRRLPLGREGGAPAGAGRWLTHAGLSLVVSSAQVLAFSLLSSTLRDTPLGLELRSSTLIKLHAGAFVYWVVLLILETLSAHGRARDEATRRARAGRAAAEARVEALQAQLRPHFLFNALNSIAALAGTDPDRTEEMIARLGGLLRRTIADGGGEATLSEELEFARDYLSIEQVRFGPRLKVDLDLAAECDDALVPRLVLQPLVENAVCHGIAPHREGGRVSISAERRDDRLTVRVTDEGAGAAVDGSNRQLLESAGFALAATRERLRLLYGSRGSLELSRGPGGGACAALCLPYRPHRAGDVP